MITCQHTSREMEKKGGGRKERKKERSGGGGRRGVIAMLRNPTCPKFSPIPQL